MGKNAYELTTVRGRTLDRDGNPDGRPGFVAFLWIERLGSDGRSERLVQVDEVPTLPRDVIRSYAAASPDARSDVEYALDYGPHKTVAIMGVDFGPIPVDVLDGVGRADPREGAAPTDLYVDVVELSLEGTGDGAWTSHGLRVRGPDFDSFRTYPMAELVGMTPSEAVDKARGASDEGSHSVMVSQDDDTPVHVCGVRLSWRDDLQEAVYRP